MMTTHSQILKWKQASWVLVSIFALLSAFVVSTERPVLAHSEDLPSISAQTADSLPLKPGGTERNAEPADPDGETVQIAWAKFLLQRTVSQCPVRRVARPGFPSGVDRPPKSASDSI